MFTVLIEDADGIIETVMAPTHDHALLLADAAQIDDYVVDVTIIETAVALADRTMRRYVQEIPAPMTQEV